MSFCLRPNVCKKCGKPLTMFEGCICLECEEAEQQLSDNTKEEVDFITHYDSSKYEKPSVTVDNVIFTVTENDKLALVLIKRGAFPYKDKWALPGGFVNITESIDDAATRELIEETGLKDINSEQFCTFGAVDRDPRMRVISVAYMALVPKNKLHLQAGDDAREACIFEIKNIKSAILEFECDGLHFTENELAFDHAQIIHTALNRIQNRIDYTDDAFHLLKNSKAFTIYELKQIYETVKGTKIDAGNFHRDFRRDFVDTGKVKATNKKARNKGSREATVYSKV